MYELYVTILGVLLWQSQVSVALKCQELSNIVYVVNGQNTPFPYNASSVCDAGVQYCIGVDVDTSSVSPTNYVKVSAYRFVL